jgi:hypothetical protein
MCFRCIVSTDEARLVLSCRVLRLAKCEATIPPHTLYCTDFFNGVLESGGKKINGRNIGDQRGLLCLSWPIVWNVVLLDLLRNVIGCRHIRPPITVRRLGQYFEMNEIVSGLTISTQNLDRGRSQEQEEL